MATAFFDSERQWIAAAAAGDQFAIGQLFGIYQQSLIQYCRSKGRSFQDAEEITADAINAALKVLSETRDCSMNVYGYAKQAAVTKCIDSARKAKRQGVVVDISEAREGHYAVELESDIAEREHAAAMAEALEQIDPQKLALAQIEGSDPNTRQMRSRARRYIQASATWRNMQNRFLGVVPLPVIARATKMTMPLRNAMESIPAAGIAAGAAIATAMLAPVALDALPDSKPAPSSSPSRLAAPALESSSFTRGGGHGRIPTTSSSDVAAGPQAKKTAVQPKAGATKAALGGYSENGRMSDEDLDRLRASLLYVALPNFFGDVNRDGRVDPLFEFGTSPEGMQGAVRVDLTGRSSEPVEYDPDARAEPSTEATNARDENDNYRVVRSTK